MKSPDLASARLEMFINSSVSKQTFSSSFQKNEILSATVLQEEQSTRK